MADRGTKNFSVWVVILSLFELLVEIVAKFLVTSVMEVLGFQNVIFDE